MVRCRSSSHILWLVLLTIAFSVVSCGTGLDLFGAPTATPTATDEPTPSPLPTNTPQPTAQATALAKPTLTGKVSGYIKSITLAMDSKDDTKEPINPTAIFSPNSVFHAVVAVENPPANTVFRAAWYVTNVGTVAAPNTIINSLEITSPQTGNLDFTLTPKSAWPVGTYRVELAVNGNVEQVVDFSVAASTATPIVTITPKPSGLISGVTMARDTKGEDKEPVNPTTTFQSKSIFHAIVALKSAPDNSKITAAWYVVDAGNAAAPNTKIDSTDLTTNGTRNIDFSLTPTDSWPVGAYRVDILVNGVLDQTVTFSVK
jgi:hypothetical protein